jgi:hypothetical protein
MRSCKRTIKGIPAGVVTESQSPLGMRPHLS